MRIADQIKITKQESYEDVGMLDVYEASWVRARKEVNKLSTDYIKVFAENKGKCTRRTITNGDAIEIHLPDIEGYEVMLYILEHTDGTVKKAQYQLFDNRNNVVWIKSLLSPEDHVTN